MKALSSSSLVALALGMATTAAEARMLVSGVQHAETGGTLTVEVTQLNTSSGAQTLSFPERIAGTLTISQSNVPVELVRAADAAASQSVPAGGFAQARYVLVLPEGRPPSAAALLSLAGQDTPGLAFSCRHPHTQRRPCKLPRAPARPSA